MEACTGALRRILQSRLAASAAVPSWVQLSGGEMPTRTIPPPSPFTVFSLRHHNRYPLHFPKQVIFLPFAVLQLSWHPPPLQEEVGTSVCGCPGDLSPPSPPTYTVAHLIPPSSVASPPTRFLCIHIFAIAKRSEAGAPPPSPWGAPRRSPKHPSTLPGMIDSWSVHGTVSLVTDSLTFSGPGH